MKAGQVGERMERGWSGELARVCNNRHRRKEYMTKGWDGRNIWAGNV